SPSTRSDPEVGRRMHPRIDRSVVFPLPDGPTNSASSPRRTSNVTESIARTAASPWAYVLVRLTAWMTASMGCLCLEDGCGIETRDLVDRDERGAGAHDDCQAQHADGERRRQQDRGAALGAAADHEPADDHGQRVTDQRADDRLLNDDAIQVTVRRPHRLE